MSPKNRSRLDTVLDAVTEGLANGAARYAETLPWILLRAVPLLGFAEFLHAVVGLSTWSVTGVSLGTGAFAALASRRK
jgi:hypothetical protein